MSFQERFKDKITVTGKEGLIPRTHNLPSPPSFHSTSKDKSQNHTAKTEFKHQPKAAKESTSHKAPTVPLKHQAEEAEPRERRVDNKHQRKETKQPKQVEKQEKQQKQKQHREEKPKREAVTGPALAYQPFSLDDFDQKKAKQELVKQIFKKGEAVKKEEDCAVRKEEAEHEERQSRSQARANSVKKERPSSLNKPVKLGGLGPNIGGEEWQKQKEKRDKMKEFAEQLKVAKEQHLITTDGLRAAPRKNPADEEKERARAQRAKMAEFAKNVPRPRPREVRESRPEEEKEEEGAGEMDQFQKRHREYQQRIKQL